MSKWIGVVVVAVMSASGATFCLAQPPIMDEQPPTTPLHAPLHNLDANNEMMKKVLAADGDSGPVFSAYKQWIIKYYERQKEILEEQKTVIRTANIISNVVCVVVHIALAICFWIAIKECQNGWKLRSKEPANTELAISANALSLKTTRQGIILLVFAMVLYFLYLTVVYPVTVINDKSRNSTIRAVTAEFIRSNELPVV